MKDYKIKINLALLTLLMLNKTTIELSNNSYNFKGANIILYISY